MIEQEEIEENLSEYSRHIAELATRLVLLTVVVSPMFGSILYFSTRAIPCFNEYGVLFFIGSCISLSWAVGFLFFLKGLVLMEDYEKQNHRKL